MSFGPGIFLQPHLYNVMPVVPLEMVFQVFVYSYILSPLPVLIVGHFCLEHSIKKDREAGARLEGRAKEEQPRGGGVPACVLRVCQGHSRTLQVCGMPGEGLWAR